MGPVVNSPAMGRVAYFVSPHGFGHAARACAVMAEIARRRPDIHFDIFTEVPRWFFAESLSREFSYHRLASDVGLVQRTPLDEDLDATADRLDELFGGDTGADRLARGLRELGCSVVIADISPLGLMAASESSIPSVLVENFTWDWIYGNYAGAPARLRRHGRRLAEVFAAAELRIQTEPVCHRAANGVNVPPVSRSARLEAEQVRQHLGVPVNDPMVVVSMGGVPWDCSGMSRIECSEGPWIVIPGASDGAARRVGRLLLLPFHADVHHPDLVAASDAVVSKLGYSTVAETYRSGSALAFVERPRFPESEVLARWVEDRMVAAAIEEEALRNGAWLDTVNRLLTVPRRKPVDANGAVQAAGAILERFGSVMS